MIGRKTNQFSSIEHYLVTSGLAAARFYSALVHVGEGRRWQRHRSFQFNIDRHDALGHQTGKYQSKYPRETDARHDPEAVLGQEPSSVDGRLILVDETCAALSE